MLLYAGGNFFQVLEGEKSDVEEIYEAIMNDDRNKGNIVIVKEEINERTFPDWSMGFRHLTRQDKDAMEGYTEFLNVDMRPEDFAGKSSEIVGLLYQFKEDNA